MKQLSNTRRAPVGAIFALMLLTSAASFAQIHINEVESSGGVPDDWIELYNAGPSQVDLVGWRILDNDDTHVPYVFPAGSNIPAGGYFTVDIKPFFGLGSADSVRLYQPTASFDVKNVYEQYAWTADAATTYGSCPDGKGPASFRTTHSSTKNAKNDCLSPVKINEVVSNGGIPGDWVELYNPTGEAVDLSGLIFKDNVDSDIYKIPNGTTIAGLGFKVLDVADFVFGLGSADSARLYEADGTTLIDSYTWTAHGAPSWARCPDGTGAFGSPSSVTKGSANACVAAPVIPKVKINEVESADGVPGDWVELYNTDTLPVNLSGYIFKDNDDTHSYVIPSNTIIDAGKYLVLDQSVNGSPGFTFGLGDADSARLFLPDGTTLVDIYTWATVAPTTYGRCPNATGDFAVTVAPTKGAVNSCLGLIGFAPWPGGAAVSTVDVNGTFPSNLSGLAYEGTGTALPGVMWAVQNGPSVLYRLTFNGTNWVRDPSNGWATGKALKYPNGTGDPDAEGVTFANAGANGIYVSTERDNNNSGVSRIAVLRFDPSLGSPLSATHDWNLTADLPVSGPNLGAEAVVYIPDTYLTTNGFFDESKNHLYNPAEYPNHGTGLFFVGLESNGGIYGYALDHSGNGQFTRVATIISGFPSVMDLHLDSLTDDLWVECDDTCQGRTMVFRIDPTGRFKRAGAFERPTGMPNYNNEGFTIASPQECLANARPVYWSDDSADLGFALRKGTLPCGPVDTTDVVAPKAAATAAPAPNGAGWNNSNVTVTWNWADNAGGAGIDNANCPASTASSGEGTFNVSGSCKDLAGNTGNASYAVKVDKTAPSIAITSPTATVYVNTALLPLTWTASDPVSGLASVVAKLDGVPVTQGQVVDLLFQTLGNHTMELRATDVAGNTSTTSVLFTIGVTTDSLNDAIDRLLASGDIGNKGNANSLHAKVGKNPNALNAFLNELDAQQDKKLSQQAYDILRAAALYLIAHP